MSQSKAIKVNIAQNNSDFKLEPLDQQVFFFKFELLKRTLNPIQEDPEETRTCTIKYLVRGCI
jgi:hypothetical protein